jgi:hypothetical protein
MIGDYADRVTGHRKKMAALEEMLQARIDRVKAMGAWGFTIGGAFFDKKFVKDGS